MIAGICGVRNESCIIDTTLRHHLAEGIDKIFINVGSSDDGTAGIVESLAAETGRIIVRYDEDPIYHQAAVMNSLAATAGADGAEWIIPFDADEFVYAVNGGTVAEAITGLPFDKLYMQVWLHHDWSTRVVASKFWHKVAYRYSPNVQLTMGQHDVNIQGGGPGILAMRELQYQNFEHFVAKRDLWVSVLSEADRARGDSAHYEGLRNFTEEELRQEWEKMRAVETIADPIPSRVSHG